MQRVVSQNVVAQSTMVVFYGDWREEIIFCPTSPLYAEDLIGAMRKIVLLSGSR